MRNLLMIHKKTYFTGLIILLLLGYSSQSFSQNNKITSDSLVVKKDYKPKLQDAVKLDVTPTQDKEEEKPPVMTYSNPVSIFKMLPQKATLKAPVLGKSKLEDLNHSYLKTGFGNYTDVFGDLFIHSVRSKTAFYNTEAMYHSGNGPVTNSNFTTAMFDVYGKKYLPKFQGDGRINFKTDFFHFYGYNHDTFKLVKDSIRQRFTSFDIASNINNLNNKKTEFKFGGGVAYNHFADFFRSYENDLDIKLFFAPKVPVGELKAGISNDYINFFDSSAKNRNIFRFNINYKYNIDKIHLEGGFRTAKADSSDSKFHLYPFAEARANLIEEALSAYAGFGGDLQKNTFKSLAGINPYINSNLDIRNTNNAFNMYAGLNGGAASVFSYNVGVNWTKMENYVYFLTDSADNKRFIPVYDSGMNSKLNLSAQVGLKPNEHLEFNTSINYNQFTVNKLELPFLEPSFIWNFDGKYKLKEMLTIYTDINTFNRRYTRINGDSLIDALKGTFDLNIGASYRFEKYKNISAYLEFNNILGDKYEIWTNYPERGLMIKGGIIINFMPGNKR